MNTTYEEAWSQGSEGGDSRRRKSRLFVLLLLLLLLLFFLMGLFAYLFFLSPPRSQPKGRFEFLFSLYGLSRPMSSTVDRSGNIYIANNGTAEVYKFDPEGVFTSTIKGKKRSEKLYAINGIFITGQRLFITDFTGRMVNVFSLNGKALYRFPANPEDTKIYGDKGFSPYGIAEYKNELYVTSNDGIYIFSKKGKLIRSWHGRGSAPDKFDYANGIAIDKRDGTIFVSDVLNRRVKALDQKGNLKWSIGGLDKNDHMQSLFSLPRGLAFNEKRNLLYVVDTFSERIIVLNKDGKLISALGKRGIDDGQFNFPEGITYVGNDTVYIADRENNRLQALKITRFPLPLKKDINNHRKSFHDPAK